MLEVPDDGALRVPKCVGLVTSMKVIGLQATFKACFGFKTCSIGTPEILEANFLGMWIMCVRRKGGEIATSCNSCSHFNVWSRRGSGGSEHVSI